VEKDPRAFAIIGAAMEVHRELGAGFLEAVYQEAFARELAKRDIPCRAEVEIPIFYKGVRLSTAYRADLVCFDSIIVEVKALAQLTGIEESQVINYLKASGHSIGLLLNLGARSLEHRRLVMSPRKSAESA
jgi:GxxExxY protein